MLTTLSSVDAVTWVSILVKTCAYAATLTAIGSVLMAVVLRGISEDGQASLRRITIASAVIAAFFSAVRLPVRASFLMGGSLDGAFDPIILGLVLESPIGTSVAVRLAGLALILCVIWRSPAGHWLALSGALLASVSFALRGHALGEPQIILGALITLHIVGLSFWLGGLAPLTRSARFDPPARAGRLAHQFGTLAIWGVGLLALAGGGLLMLLGAATPAALSTLYGQVFVIILILFAGVLALAAVNKLLVTPALLASKPGANRHLRRSISFEAALIAGILVTTATLTTLSSPSKEGQIGQASALTPPLARAHQTFGETL